MRNLPERDAFLRERARKVIASVTTDADQAEHLYRVVVNDSKAWDRGQCSADVLTLWIAETVINEKLRLECLS